MSSRLHRERAPDPQPRRATKQAGRHDPPVPGLSRLQRLVGNRATTRLVRGGVVHRTNGATATAAPVVTEHTWTHVFEGEVKRGGRLVGYHSRPGGTDFGNNQVDRNTIVAKQDGCYEARWQRPGLTRKFSTFFPDSWDRPTVQKAIREGVADAHANNRIQSNGYFEGQSSSGLWVQGYVNNNQVSTAFPKV